MDWEYLIVPTLGVVLCPFALIYFWEIIHCSRKQKTI